MTPPVGNSLKHQRNCRTCNLPYTFDPEGEAKAAEAERKFFEAHAEKAEEVAEIDALLGDVEEEDEDDEVDSWANSDLVEV
jgi:hypothetical protein